MLQLFIAKMLPENLLLEEVVKSINQYITDNSEDNKIAMKAMVSMAALRFTTEDESMEDLLKSVEKFERMKEIEDVVRAAESKNQN